MEETRKRLASTGNKEANKKRIYCLLYFYILTICYSTSHTHIETSHKGCFLLYCILVSEMIICSIDDWLDMYGGGEYDYTKFKCFVFAHPDEIPSNVCEACFGMGPKGLVSLIRTLQV